MSLFFPRSPDTGVGFCFYFPLSECLKLNNKYMLNEENFTYKRQIYLTLVHVKIYLNER